MSQPKTRPTGASPEAFIDALEDPGRRDEARRLVRLMSELTGEPAVMWGENIIGFGSYHFRYDSGREGDWFRIGFSPRKRELSLYVMPELAAHEELLQRLGKHRRGVCCLYLKQLDAADPEVLRALLAASLRDLRERYG